MNRPRECRRSFVCKCVRYYLVHSDRWRYSLQTEILWQNGGSAIFIVVCAPVRSEHPKEDKRISTFICISIRDRDRVMWKCVRNEIESEN